MSIEKMIEVSFMKDFRGDVSEFQHKKENVYKINLPQYVFEHLSKLFIKPNDDLSIRLDKTYYCNHCHQKIKYTAETFGGKFARGSQWECKCGSWDAGIDIFTKKTPKISTMIPKYHKFTTSELAERKEEAHRIVDSYYNTVAIGKPGRFDTPTENL